MKKNKDFDVINYDNEGNVIEDSFPVSERTKKDHRKTSVGYSLIAFLLHALAIIPPIAVSAVLAVKCYKLVPYYSFWPFVGMIIVGVFALIYGVVTLIVTRRNSKSSIGSQTAKVAVTFACLTSIFALILTYIVPDIISMATQNTLYVEDLYYNGDEQAEINAKLDRDFIMYNVLNGNLNDHTDSEHGDYSYKTLADCDKNSGGGVNRYNNPEIEASYQQYKAYGSIEKLQTDVIDVMEQLQPRKYELYQFIYNVYVLNDFTYAFYNDINRRAIALAVLDYEYEHANYDGLLKEGFSNKKLKDLFDKNFDNFNQDGYQTFDDALLLYAQMPNRMTVSVVLRLILNEGWMYSQPVTDGDRSYFTEDGNLLYEVYDVETFNKYIKEKGMENDEGEIINYDELFGYEGTIMNGDGTELTVKYGFNEDGWMIFENGVVKRPINWLVLDMLGDKMDLATLSVMGSLKDLIKGIINMPDATFDVFFNKLFDSIRNLFNAAGLLVQEDLQKVVEEATNGANINIGLYFNDDGDLTVNIYPMNYEYGMLGYMQASWVQSNNLLMAVINLIGLRNWLCIFGALGVVLVIAAGICRECGRKTRVRTEVSRDRMVRARTSKKRADGEELFLDDRYKEDKSAADGEASDGKRKKKKKKKSDEEAPIEDGLNDTFDVGAENASPFETEAANTEAAEPFAFNPVAEEPAAVFDENVENEEQIQTFANEQFGENVNELTDTEIGAEQTEQFAAEQENELDFSSVEAEALNAESAENAETELSATESAEEEHAERIEQKSGKKDKKKKKKKRGEADEQPIESVSEDNLTELVAEDQIEQKPEADEVNAEMSEQFVSEESAAEQPTELPETEDVNLNSDQGASEPAFEEFSELTETEEGNAEQTELPPSEPIDAAEQFDVTEQIFEETEVRYNTEAAELEEVLVKEQADSSEAELFAQETENEYTEFVEEKPFEPTEAEEAGIEQIEQPIELIEETPAESFETEAANAEQAEFPTAEFSEEEHLELSKLDDANSEAAEQVNEERIDPQASEGMNEVQFAEEPVDTSVLEQIFEEPADLFEQKPNKKGKKKKKK